MNKLGFGLMRLPLLDENNRAGIDQEQVNRMVDVCLEWGINYFDTGYPYHNGMSEVAAQQALSRRHPRTSFLLADKMPTFLVKSPADYPRFFQQQLERCGVDYFDYYLLHSLGEKNYADTLNHGGFSFVRRLRQEGKIKRLGFSYHDSAALLDRILTDHPEMEFVQLQINYIDWDDESIQSRKCYEVARKHGKPVIVMEPLKGGALANVPEEAHRLMRAHRPDLSTASWAIRYAASLEGVLTVLSGMSSMDQLMDNISYMKAFAPLDEVEREIVAQVADIIGRNTAFPCTACQYCVEGCAQNIPIPRYLSLFNNQKQFGLLPLHHNYYMNLSQTHGKASACVGCGQCEAQCPQHLRIAEGMAEVAKVFEHA